MNDQPNDIDPQADYDALYRIMTRRLSARRLKSDPVPDESIEKIMEAGR